VICLLARRLAATAIKNAGFSSNSWVYAGDDANAGDVAHERLPLAN
jgi:hypothetical protein